MSEYMSTNKMAESEMAPFQGALSAESPSIKSFQRSNLKLKATFELYIRRGNNKYLDRKKHIGDLLVTSTAFSQMI